MIVLLVIYIEDLVKCLVVIYESIFSVKEMVKVFFVY